MKTICRLVILIIFLFVAACSTAAETPVSTPPEAAPEEVIPDAIAGPTDIPESEFPVSDLPGADRPGPELPDADLYPTALTIMATDGVAHFMLDSTPSVTVMHGAVIRVNLYVRIDLADEDGLDVPDRNEVEVKVWGRLLEPPDVVVTHMEDYFEEAIEFNYISMPPVLLMDFNGVDEGLAAAGFLAADKFPIQEEFEADEWPSDFVLAEYVPPELDQVEPDIANSVINEQLPRVRYLNAGGDHGINNHMHPREQYSVDYTTKIGGKPFTFPWLVYTFEFASSDLLNGIWELGATVDHRDKIGERNEGNNTILANFAISPLDPTWQPTYDTWWEEQWEREQRLCDPWGEDPEPTEFKTSLTRVRWWDGGATYVESDGWHFWRDQGMGGVARTELYITEFWGPRGLGQFCEGTCGIPGIHDGVWKRYYDFEGSPPRPLPEEIENVFLFFSGNSGCYSRASVPTGQKDYHCAFLNAHITRKVYEIMDDSWPGQLAIKWPAYEDKFNPYNSVLTMAFQHNGRTHYLSDTQEQNAEGFVDYMVDRTDGFRKVRHVWLGGASRGGAVAIRVAKILKQRIVNGEINPPDDMRVIVTGTDAVGLHVRDDLNFTGHVYLCAGGFCRDANSYNMTRNFPYNTDPALDHTRNLFIRQTVGNSTGFDSLVHRLYPIGGTEDWTMEEELPGNFWSQDLEGLVNGRTHGEMCTQWIQESAISGIQYFFRKALDEHGYPWDPDYAPYPDGCR